MSPNAELLVAIDERLRDWQQGDVLLGIDLPFFRLASYDRPITTESEKVAAARTATEDVLATIAIDVPGFVIISQTCDLIRPCEERPLLKLAPLVDVSNAVLKQARQGVRPRYAFIPGVADRSLVADLDSVMTVEKALIAFEPQEAFIRGCSTDDELLKFGVALSRNVDRFAFPDEFVKAIGKIQQRIVSKHGKQTYDKKRNPTNEGELYAALREIRVMCAPSWDAQKVNLTLLFIRDDHAELPADSEALIDDLMKRFEATGPFQDPMFRLVRMSEISAATYAVSQPLDLDHLSTP